MEEILKQILESQIDIKKILQQQSQILQRHDKTLERQGDTLQRQSDQLDSLLKGQTKLESRTDSLDRNQIKLETRIESEIIEKIRALYDARSVQDDINTKIIDTIERIETKIDVLQMETTHVRKT